MNSRIDVRPGSSGLTEEDRRAILGMPERHGPLTLAADWDSMNEDYAEDVLVMLPGLPDMRGRGALRALQEGFPRMKVSEVRIDELDGCGSIAYARFTYRMQLEAKGALEETGRGIWILRKGADRQWRIALDISAPDCSPSQEGES